MTRIRAFLVHLSASTTIFLIYLSIVLLYWYPPPFFQLEASWNVIRVVIGVDLVLGPLLTLIVFKPGKRGLRFDMTAIILMQIAALAWGIHVTHAARPMYAVFNVDRFTVVGANDVDVEAVPAPALRHAGWSGPLLVAARAARDAAETAELTSRFLDTGRDLYLMEDRYAPLEVERAQIERRALDIRARIAANPLLRTELESWRSAGDGSLDEFLFFPIEGRRRNGLVILSRSDLRLVDIRTVDPW